MRQISTRRGFSPAMRTGILALFVVPFLAGCGGLSGVSDFINTKTKFSSKEYGVAASPRVTTSKNVPKGGGRKLVGKPYKVAGKWYTPKHDPNYDNTGGASWYGPNFHGRRTANGEIFDQNAITAAHPTLPLPSYVRVTNLENNRSMLVRVNDRGPFVHGREIDLSKRAAELLGYQGKGLARVRVKYVGEAPLEGDDTRMLMASLNGPTFMERSRATETRVALADTSAPAVRPLAAIGRHTSGGNVSVTPEGFNIVHNASAGGLGPLFYAAPDFDGQRMDLTIDSAFDAAEAMATRARDLEGWREGVDADARNVHVQLGIFRSRDNAEQVIDAFSLIGAVDVAEIDYGGARATAVTLTQLKPGARPEDIVERATELGLNDVIRY